MYTFCFERLEVWIKYRLLTKKIYKLTQDFKWAVSGAGDSSFIPLCGILSE